MTEDRFLSPKQLKARGIPWSRQYVHKLEKLGRFPKRVVLGPKTIAWRESEIQAWEESRLNAS